MTRWEFDDVPVETTREVRERLARGQSCLVVGRAGTGKTHAVRAAVNGVAWINLRSGGRQHARFFVDLARQIPHGDQLLRALADGRPQECHALATELLGARALVVDRAERLVESIDWGWDEPLHALAQAESVGLCRWLWQHASTHPTAIVSRRSIRPAEAEATIDEVSHDTPKGLCSEALSLMLERTARHVGDRPGGLTLARAIAPFVDDGPADVDLVDQFGYEEGPIGAFRALGAVFRERAPSRWHLVLAAVDALDDAERVVIEEVLSHADRSALTALIRLGLVEERRGGRLGVLSTLNDSRGLRPLDAAARSDLLHRLARALLGRVNDPTSLEPRDADRVLHAHALYIELGDFENAQRTARIHLNELIALARRTSISGAREIARRQYEMIRDLMRASPSEEDPITPRTRSYVTHYHAYNGQLAGTLPKDKILAEYEEAIKLWPENALWHQRRIELLIELDRADEAKAAIELAYSSGNVIEHARRDTFLRVRPALAAFDHGDPVLALELIEPVINLSWDRDPEGASSIAAILDGWSKGVEIEELAHETGVLVFKRPEWVELDRLGDSWQARLTSLDVVVISDPAIATLRLLSKTIADEAEQLFRSPSHELLDAAVERKSELIAHLDPLNSDLGLEHAPERWLLGRIEGNQFVFTQREYSPVSIDANAKVAADRLEVGLYFGRVPVYRDGHPKSAVQELVPAGSGRSLKEVLRELRDLRPEPPESGHRRDG